MNAYYSEWDQHAAAWLRSLMAAGLIPEGVVDERSIKDVAPADVAGLGQRHFFAGVGGWCEALRLAGWPAGRSVWTGSCPCQPYSSAGKRQGNDDARDLWPDFFRLIRECRPERLIGEQVEGAIRHGWLDRVCADLEGEGYAVGHCVLGAHSVGAPHIRQRLYWVASRLGNAHVAGPQGRCLCGCGRAGQCPVGPAGGDARGLADAEVHRLGQRAAVAGRGREGVRPQGDGVGPADDGDARGFWDAYDLIPCRDGKSRRVEPGTFPLAHGFPRDLGPLLAVLGRMGVDPKLARRAVRNARGRLAKAGRNRVGRLRGYGNALCVPTAAAFVRAFLDAEAGER